MADSLAEIKLSFHSPVFFPAFISNSLRCQVLHKGHIKDQKLLPLGIKKGNRRQNSCEEKRKNSSPLWAARWREVFVGKYMYIHNQVMSLDCGPWAADGLPGVRRWEQREWVFGLFVILVADGNNCKQKVWERNSTFWKNVWPLFWVLFQVMGPLKEPQLPYCSQWLPDSSPVKRGWLPLYIDYVGDNFCCVCWISHDLLTFHVGIWLKIWSRWLG